MRNKVMLLAFVLIFAVPINSVFAEAPPWENQKIQVIGFSALNLNKYTPGRAKLMAKRGATIAAQMKAVKEILEFYLNLQTKVKDVIAQKDDLYALSSILIKEYTIISSEWNNEMCTVVLEVKLSQVYNYLKQEGLLSKLQKKP